jgi:hypothetical protein
VAQELLRTVAASQPHYQPSATEDVQGGGLLGQSEGVVERQHPDGYAQPDALGPRRDGCQQHARRGRDAVVGVMVLGEPDRVEAEPLREHHLLDLVGDDRLGCSARRGLEKVVGSEPHRSHPIAFDSFPSLLSSRHV